MTSTNAQTPKRTRAALALELSPRDREVVRYVGQFGQVTSQHIERLFFHELASTTPCKRTLRRLLEGRYLVRLERAIGGIHGGGSTRAVYQLGREGWRYLERPGEYWARRAIDQHGLMIADCYAHLVEAQHRNELKILKYRTEPDCHQTVGTHLLTPDLFTQIGFLRQGERGPKYDIVWEIDRGTEHTSALGKIREKLARYQAAYNLWPTCGPERYFPEIIFVVPDTKRQRAIERAIETQPSEARELFRVWEMGHFPQELHRLGLG